MSAVGEGSAVGLRSSLRSLQAYLAEHQREEEQWMEDAGYPGAREHLRAHAAILERIAAARADTTVGWDRRLLDAAQWVARALESHMRGDDLKLGRFWTARETDGRRQRFPGCRSNLGTSHPARTRFGGWTRAAARQRAKTAPPFRMGNSA